MSGGGFQHHRTYSQSRFPPPGDVGSTAPAGFSTLERNQRSKSFDNRRDFWGQPDSSPSRQYGASPRTHFATDRDSSNFFNDSITVPIQKTGPTGGGGTGPYSTSVPIKQYRSAIELNTDGSDDEWKSYDRTVRYNHNRTVLPPVAVPRSQYYDEYSSRHHRIEPPPLRYPEPDYAAFAQQQREQQLHQQQQQQQQHSESIYRSQRQNQSDSRAAEAAAGVYRPQAYYDEDYVGASTFGRSAAGGAAASTGGGGHRSYHESYARQSGGGGGIGGRSYSQHYSNGYGYGGNAAHHKSHVNTSKGGLFGSKSATKSKHRDVSLPVQKRPRTYHKIHCCCFSFYWPPWAYEPVEPPTPIFYDRKAFARRGPPPSQLLTPQISPRQGGGPPQRFVGSPEPPPSTINQHPPPLQPPPPSLLHPNQAGLMPPPAVHY